MVEILLAIGIAVALGVAWSLGLRDQDRYLNPPDHSDGGESDE